MSYAQQFVQYHQRVLELAPSVYWMLDEKGGTVAYDLVSGRVVGALNGTYGGGVGLTFNQPGIGDGRGAIEYNGTDTYVQIAVLNAVWNGDKGSMAAWGRVDGAARWTDASTFRYLWHARSTVDDTYYIVFGKHTDAQTLFYRRRSGGVIFEQKKAFVAGPTDWFFQGFTYDIVADSVACYVWTSSGGFETVYSGTFGGKGNTAWGVNPIGPGGGTTVLGAGSITLQEWVGREAHAAYWSGAALSVEQMRFLSVVE